MIATDGVVTLRAPAPGDAERLVAGRDEEFARWLGPGDEKPVPTACIWVGEELVGWVDYDFGEHRHWLEPGEVNVGYYLFPAARGRGYASRAVELLVRELGDLVATLTIDPANERSLALARRCGFEEAGTVGHSLFFRRRSARRPRA